MIAQQIVESIREAGATIMAADGKLRVIPADVLTAGSKAALKAHKAEVLAFLRSEDPLQPALAAAVRDLPITAAEVLAAMAPEDIQDWRDGRTSPRWLAAFALCCYETREREAGRVPAAWTETAVCARCGPIWHHHGGTIESCHWCVNRISGLPIPRPASVTCQTCRYFRRRDDHPHLGGCTIGMQSAAPAGFWGTDSRACNRWLPIDPINSPDQEAKQ